MTINKKEINKPIFLARAPHVIIVTPICFALAGLASIHYTLNFWCGLRMPVTFMTINHALTLNSWTKAKSFIYCIYLQIEKIFFIAPSWIIICGTNHGYSKVFWKVRMLMKFFRKKANLHLNSDRPKQKRTAEIARSRE